MLKKVLTIVAAGQLVENDLGDADLWAEATDPVDRSR